MAVEGHLDLLQLVEAMDDRNNRHDTSPGLVLNAVSPVTENMHLECDSRYYKVTTK